EDRVDRLRETGQAAGANEEHVLDAAVSQLGQHARPEAGALGLLDPEAQAVTLAVERDPDRDVDGLLPDDLLIADRHLHRVQVDGDVHLLERSALPCLTSSWIDAVTSLISPSETSTPYSSRRCRWISRVVIPPAYRARICSSKPSNERACLGTIRGSKLASRSRGSSTVTGPSTVRNVFDADPFRRFGYCSGASAPGR